MWDTKVFAFELVGMVVLMLAVIGSITVAKKYKLQGIASVSFGAATCGLGLMAAIMIGNAAGTGFINPGATLLIAVLRTGETNTIWNEVMLSAMVGQFVAVISVAVVFVLARLVLKACMKEESAYLFEAFASDTSFAKPGKTIIGEMMGTAIFFGTIMMVARFSGAADGSLIAITVSLGLVGAIFATSNLGSMLNPGVGFGLMLIKTMTTMGKGFKFDFANYSLGAIANYAMAAAIGGIGYGLALTL